MKVLLIIHKKVNCPTMGRKGAGINQRYLSHNFMVPCRIMFESHFDFGW
jgi:hypothetical protein